MGVFNWDAKREVGEAVSLLTFRRIAQSFSASPLGCDKLWPIHLGLVSFYLACLLDGYSSYLWMTIYVVSFYW